jgi:hypothetical protein
MLRTCGSSNVTSIPCFSDHSTTTYLSIRLLRLRHRSKLSKSLLRLIARPIERIHSSSTEGDLTPEGLVAHRDRKVVVDANLTRGMPHQESSVCVAEMHTPSAKSVSAPTGHEDSDWSSSEYDIDASLRLAHEP